MEYTIKGLADLSGVTTRTLRWYDETGLLKPARHTAAGYRIYGPAQADRLQLILFYRELGLELCAIRPLLDDPQFDRQAALQSHLAALEARRVQLDALILTVRKTLDAEKGGNTMSDTEKFECFKQDIIKQNEEAYGTEIRAQYGDAAVDTSNSKLAALSPEAYADWEALGRGIRSKLAEAVRTGSLPTGKTGADLTDLHRQWLCYTWASYGKAAHNSCGTPSSATSNNALLQGCLQRLGQLVWA